MPEYHLAEAEKKFAQLIWKHEPLPSRRLVELAAQELGWKSTTTYTVLRRLCDRGLFQNEKSQVTSLVSREEFCRQQSRSFVQARCPAFSRRLWAGASSRRPRRRSCGT
mgnify:CR=1 FL=1